MIPSIALAIVCLALLYLLREERRTADRERQLLLNRIQAPEVAVTQTLPDDAPVKGFVDFESDEDYHSFMRELNDGGS
jgi:hypothetical protein